MPYELNEHEKRLIEDVARGRQENNLKHGFTEMKVGDGSFESVDRNGVAGEWVASRLLNVSMDLRTDYEDPKQVPKWDLAFFGTIDVKTTTYSNGSLLVPRHKYPKDLEAIDYYCLVTGDWEEGYMVRGFAKSSDVLQQSNLVAMRKDRPNVLSYRLFQSELIPLVEFYNEMYGL